MKIRDGFVSNSSVSSFLVKHNSYWPDSKAILTKAQEKKLEKFGFRKTTATCPEGVDKQSFIDALISRGHYNYGYDVICNQDEPIAFLLKNKISFEAEVHYGDESWYYDGNTDKLVIGQNVGKQLGSILHCSDSDLRQFRTEHADRKGVIEETTGKNYLKIEAENDKKFKKMVKEGKTIKIPKV